MSRRQLYAEKGPPAWSWLVATLNDPDLIAVVLFCMIILVVSAGRLRWNEWYFATHPVGGGSACDHRGNGGRIPHLPRTFDEGGQFAVTRWLSHRPPRALRGRSIGATSRRYMPRRGGAGD